MHHVCCRIIFLDEPTSGGRPDTSKSCYAACKCMHRVSSIVSTIMKPC